LGRSGARFINSVRAMSNLVVVFALETLDTRAAVELVAKHFVCLAEAVELGC